MFKKVIVLLATMLLLGLIAACGLATPPQTVTVVETVVVTVLVEKGQVPANNSFSYPVRVQAKRTGEHIPDAKITIEVIGKAPLDEITDANGFARIFIDADRVGQPGKLIIQATGYKQYIQNIDLTEGNLPDVLQLEPIPPTNTPIPEPTHTPTSTPTDTPTSPPPPTPECRFDNLLNCSDPVPVFVPGESYCTITLISEGLQSKSLHVEFDNQQNGSGVAFKFAPALDVRGFTHLELNGTSTQDFMFLVEYKVLVGTNLQIVKTSVSQLFPVNSEGLSIRIPLVDDGTIDEMVINFPDLGERSELVIKSIRLLQ